MSAIELDAFVVISSGKAPGMGSHFVRVAGPWNRRGRVTNFLHLT